MLITTFGSNGRLRRRAFLALLIFSTTAASAEIGYYFQSLYGGAKVLAKRRSIEKILRDPELDSELRGQLETALEIREFASRELGLPDNKSYRTYVDLQREAVSWTVTAAPKFSTTPIRWCFPIAGCVSYRGYFTPDKAESFAEELRAEGHDVTWGGVSAYSTLGWFADPILSTFWTRSEIDLAGLIFHELAHQVVYVKDSTQFNESFATAVEFEGVRRWLDARGGDPSEIERYRTSQEREERFTDVALEFRTRLGELYRSDVNADTKASGKAKVFGELQVALRALREEWGNPNALSGWIGADLNNAHLASIGAYHEWVPAFEALLAKSADLSAFYQAVRELADLDPTTREVRLQTLAD